MFDSAIRRGLRGPLGRFASGIDFKFVTPNRITALGLALGLGSSIAAWKHQWAIALIFWLLSRIADGVDGSLARLRAVTGRSSPTLVGGYLDIMADFAVYGSFVVGVAHGVGGSIAPFLWVLLAYYLNGSAFLAFSSIGERAGIRLDDGRSLSFIAGFAEGAETIAVHSLWCLFPSSAGRIASVWAGVVLLSALSRSFHAYKLLSRPRNESGLERVPTSDNDQRGAESA